MIAHWDDAPGRAVELGDMHVDWSDLGVAAGSVAVGCRRARIRPGRRSTPVHRHHAEEELYFVLGGDGLVWRDGATHEVRAGDALLEPALGPAHTLVAGDGGLDVLCFGPRRTAEVAELPRAGVTWVGRTWVEAGRAPIPFAREAEAGPLELPDAPSPRPATIVAADDVDAEHKRMGRTDCVRRNLGEALGSRTTGMRLLDIAAGGEGYPPHVHTAEEELFVVLGGSGAARLGDEEHPVRRGHVVARPAGTRVAHSFAAGGEPLRLLAYGERDPRDICFYPRSKKVAIRGAGVTFRVEPLDYWDGEA